MPNIGPADDTVEIFSFLVILRPGSDPGALSELTAP